MLLIWLIILQVQVTRILCKFIDGSPSWKVVTLPNLVAIGIMAVKIKWFKWLKSKISHADLNLPLLFISKVRGMKAQVISS